MIRVVVRMLSAGLGDQVGCCRGQVRSRLTLYAASNPEGSE